MTAHPVHGKKRSPVAVITEANWRFVRIAVVRLFHWQQDTEMNVITKKKVFALLFTDDSLSNH